MPDPRKPATVDLDGRRLFRLGRSDNPLRFAEIAPGDAALPAGGNRFDVVGGLVLYAADSAETAFHELLRESRPDAASLADPDPEKRAANVVTAAWRARKLLVEFSLDDPFPFLDLSHPATHAVLTAELAAELAARGVDRVDVGVTLSRDRTLTRLFSHWAYVQWGEDGLPLYGGVAYPSRTDSRQCFAIFSWQDPIDAVAHVISADEPALLAAAEHYGLEIE